MTKPVLGLVVGGVLGLLDGLSAWFSPEARPILLGIVIGSTVKGLVTGVIAGLIARWKHSVALGLLSGLALGFAGSSLAAWSQPDHYFEIVLPGMLVGAIVGFVTQRYPVAVGSGVSQRSLVLVALTMVGSTLLASGVQRNAPAAAPDRLAPVAVLLGRWVGTTEGRPGKGTIEREYVRLLGTRFIQARNRSSYPPQEKNPKGEVHEDMGVFSFDASRKALVVRHSTSRASSVSTCWRPRRPPRGSCLRPRASRTSRLAGAHARPTPSPARTRSRRSSNWPSPASHSRCIPALASRGLPELRSTVTSTRRAWASSGLRRGRDRRTRRARPASPRAALTAPSVRDGD
jgi:hypothetical protein